MSLYLLDTNVISELGRRLPNKKVFTFLEGLDEIVVSAITIEEIDYGIARIGLDFQKPLLEWWNSFLSIPPVVVPVDSKIARVAGGLRAKAEREGKHITQADSLIAATAFVSGRVLVTRNIKDFIITGVQLYDPFI